MISREWSCRCAPANADRYEQMLLTDILPELDRVEGCRGAYVFRRDVGDEVEFVVLHLFDSPDAIRDFAGADYETALVPDQARALTTSSDPVARHFDIRAEPDPAR